MELITLANNKPAFSLRKPSLLKDYLLDDLSSCSSNGFRSYPRRQHCCTSVRFLLDADMKNKKLPQSLPQKSRSSAFKRASAAVINAVKSTYKLKLARKLLKRSFWKSPDPKQIQCGSKSGSPPAVVYAGSPNSGDSLSSTSGSNSKSKSTSWSDSDFTVSDGNSITVENMNQASSDVVSVKNSTRDRDHGKRGSKNKAVSVSRREGVIVGGGDDSSSNSSTSSNNLKQCQIKEEEKEQLSPVSVLDCPFDDEDEVSSSPFQHRLARMEGTKKRLMRKIKKFEKLTHLEPVNLENRIVLSCDSSDPDTDKSPHCHSSESTCEDSSIDDEDNEDEEHHSVSDNRSCQLLHDLVVSTMPSQKADYCDILLLDFFKDGIEMGVNRIRISLDHELINVAKDWINGQPRGEDPKNREPYIRDMENAGKWRNLDEEKHEVALELEVEVFASLMNELCHDLLS